MYPVYPQRISLSSVSKTTHARVVEKQFTVDKPLRCAMAYHANDPQWSFHAKLFTQQRCQRICGTVFYRCNLVLVTLFFVLSTVHPTAAQLSKTNGIMLPSVKHQVINSGSNFSITCIFVHNATIGWSLPDYYEFQKLQVSYPQSITVRQHKFN